MIWREWESTLAKKLMARKLPFSPRAIVSAINITFAAVLVGVLLYPSAQPERLERMPAPAAPLAPEPEPPVSERGVPVRVVNPFDETEVFEFPPGTSETEAHDLVANLLIERARSRLHRIDRRADNRTPRGKAT